MKKNIILVTLDCVRRDHLGCYGKEDIRTPCIDKIASKGVMVEKAYTHCPITGPAHYSLFTSTLPVTHQLRLNGVEIKKKFTSMAQILSAHGYNSSAFTGAFVLDSRFGFARGFDHYDGNMVGWGEKIILKMFGYSKKWADMVIPKFSRNADQVTASSVKWLKNKKDNKPFFLWLHYFDAHDHFRLPLPLNLYYYRRRDYKRSVEYIDKNLGKLIKHLTKTGQMDNTIFVITSDHGEILGEYEYLGKKYRGHAPLAYELTLKVPLIFSGPGIRKSGNMLKRTFRHIDLMPTIISMAGIDAIAYKHIEGEDLSGFLQEDKGAGEEPYIYAETIHPTTKGEPEWRVMIKGKWKFVFKPQSKEEILYDLEKDPTEKQNVISSNEGKAAELREVLLNIMKNDKIITDESQNPEVRKALESLGYM